MMKGHNGQLVNNERLEYLGDALLGAIVAHELYIRFPHSDEGMLTKVRSRVVNRTNMNRLALELGLCDLIKTQPLTDIPNTHIPGDALEALIGALYLDKGYKAVAEFVVKKIINQTTDLHATFDSDTNYKSVLIEWGQKNKREINFVTEECFNSTEGEDTFISHIYVDKELVGSGRGASKRDSQHKAASLALSKMTKFYSSSLN